MARWNTTEKTTTMGTIPATTTRGSTAENTMVKLTRKYDGTNKDNYATVTGMATGETRDSTGRTTTESTGTTMIQRHHCEKSNVCLGIPISLH